MKSARTASSRIGLLHRPSSVVESRAAAELGSAAEGGRPNRAAVARPKRDRRQSLPAALGAGATTRRGAPAADVPETRSAGEMFATCSAPVDVARRRPRAARARAGPTTPSSARRAWPHAVHRTASRRTPFRKRPRFRRREPRRRRRPERRRESAARAAARAGALAERALPPDARRLRFGNASEARLQRDGARGSCADGRRRRPPPGRAVIGRVRGAVLRAPRRTSAAQGRCHWWADAGRARVRRTSHVPPAVDGNSLPSASPRAAEATSGSAIGAAADAKRARVVAGRSASMAAASSGGRFRGDLERATTLTTSALGVRVPIRRTAAGVAAGATPPRHQTAPFSATNAC